MHSASTLATTALTFLLFVYMETAFSVSKNCTFFENRVPLRRVFRNCQYILFSHVHE